MRIKKLATPLRRPDSIKNRPFPSSLVPLFQGESNCETILMKTTLICMKMKLHAELIFIWKVSHLDSFWNRGTRELGNGLLALHLLRHVCGLKNLAPIFHPIKSKTKINRDVLAQVFPRFASCNYSTHVITLNFDWFTVCDLSDWQKWLFGFGFTTLSLNSFSLLKELRYTPF